MSEASVKIGHAHGPELSTSASSVSVDQWDPSDGGKPWNYVARLKDRTKAYVLATKMKAACDNNYVVYSQTYRTQVYDFVRKGGKIEELNEYKYCDCSSLTAAMLLYCGIDFGEYPFNTAGMITALAKSDEFTVFNDVAHTHSCKNLLIGDIAWRDKTLNNGSGHAAVVVYSEYDLNQKYEEASSTVTIDGEEIEVDYREPQEIEIPEMEELAKNGNLGSGRLKISFDTGMIIDKETGKVEYIIDPNTGKPIPKTDGIHAVGNGHIGFVNDGVIPVVRTRAPRKLNEFSDMELIMIGIHMADAMLESVRAHEENPGLLYNNRENLSGYATHQAELTDQQWFNIEVGFMYEITCRNAYIAYQERIRSLRDTLPVDLETMEDLNLYIVSDTVEKYNNLYDQEHEEMFDESEPDRHGKAIYTDIRYHAIGLSGTADYQAYMRYDSGIPRVLHEDTDNDNRVFRTESGILAIVQDKFGSVIYRNEEAEEPFYLVDNDTKIMRNEDNQLCYIELIKEYNEDETVKEYVYIERNIGAMYEPIEIKKIHIEVGAFLVPSYSSKYSKFPTYVDTTFFGGTRIVPESIETTYGSKIFSENIEKSFIGFRYNGVKSVNGTLYFSDDEQYDKINDNHFGYDIIFELELKNSIFVEAGYVLPIFNFSVENIGTNYASYYYSSISGQTFNRVSEYLLNDVEKSYVRKKNLIGLPPAIGSEHTKYGGFGTEDGYSGWGWTAVVRDADDGDEMFNNISSGVDIKGNMPSSPYKNNLDNGLEDHNGIQYWNIDSEEYKTALEENGYIRYKSKLYSDKETDIIIDVKDENGNTIYPGIKVHLNEGINDIDIKIPMYNEEGYNDEAEITINMQEDPEGENPFIGAKDSEAIIQASESAPKPNKAASQEDKITVEDEIEVIVHENIDNYDNEITEDIIIEDDIEVNKHTLFSWDNEQEDAATISDEEDTE